MEEIMELVIKRSEWLRSDPYSMYMLSETGTKCILGFLGKTLGIEEKILKDCYPKKEERSWPKWLFEINQHVGKTNYHYIADINDSLKTSDTEKEERLAAIFGENNIELLFVD